MTFDEIRFRGEGGNARPLLLSSLVVTRPVTLRLLSERAEQRGRARRRRGTEEKRRQGAKGKSLARARRRDVYMIADTTSPRNAECVCGIAPISRREWDCEPRESRGDCALNDVRIDFIGREMRNCLEILHDKNERRRYARNDFFVYNFYVLSEFF